MKIDPHCQRANCCALKVLLNDVAYRLRWYCCAIVSGGRFSELCHIYHYHGCRTLTFALSPVHTVAEKCDCRRKRRLSPNSATVSLFCDSVDRALARLSCYYRYLYVTLLREPTARYLSEWKHVQRGSTWQSAQLVCDGRSATLDEVPFCFHGIVLWIIGSDRRVKNWRIVRFRSGRVRDRVRDKDRRSEPDRQSEAINFGAC